MNGFWADLGLLSAFLHSGVGLGMAALVVDRLVGDPGWLPHPVVLLGRCITWLETRARPMLQSAREERVIGGCLVVLVVVAAYVVTWNVVALVGCLQPWVGWFLNVWLASTTIASKGLEQAAVAVLEPFCRGDLTEARHQVGYIVGRDTEALDEPEILRATVETVAENTVDAVIAPLFFTLCGGAPLAMAYRAVNTLDSMWGYRNAKYCHFGWAAARLDDAANRLPARMTALLLPCAAWMFGYDGRRAWQTIRRDAPRHPSPNAGIPEAGVAGALGIQLGGWNSYGGERQFRAYMGEAGRVPVTNDVRLTIRLLHGATGLFLMAVVLAVGTGWLLWP